MTEEVRIGNDPDAQLVLDQPKFKADGWLESYRIRLESPSMSAEVLVDNAPFGESPVEYFQTLSKNWKGWEGAKSWRALEDEYRLSATMSRTGHVTLTTRLNVYSYFWEAKANLDIEAGRKHARRIRPNHRLSSTTHARRSAPDHSAIGFSSRTASPGSWTDASRFCDRGRSPHKFTPMSVIHTALVRTHITLRFICAAQLGRSILKRIYECDCY